MRGSDPGSAPVRVMAFGTTAMFIGLGMVLVAVGLWGRARGWSIGAGIGGLWLASVGLRARARARTMLRASRTRP